MAEQNVWVRGALVRLTASFYDENGVLADPTTRTIRLTDKDGVSVGDFTGGSLTQVATGIWRYKWDSTAVADNKLGVYIYAGLGTGTVQAAGKRSFVLVSEKTP